MFPIEVCFLTGKVIAFGLPVNLPEKEEQLLFTIASGDPVIHHERLLDQIWPEADGDAAHNRLRVCLHRLRKHLCHEPLIEHVQTGYSLSSDVRVDLREVRALLSGVVNVPALKVFFDQARDGRVARQALGDWFYPFEVLIAGYQHKAACIIADAALQAGDRQTAVSYARAVLAEDAMNVPAGEILLKM